MPESQFLSTPTPTPATAESLVSASAARRDYLGDISEVTEWRWAKQLAGFPVPVRINGRKFYRRGDLLAFLDRLAAGRAPASDGGGR